MLIIFIGDDVDMQVWQPVCIHCHVIGLTKRDFKIKVPDTTINLHFMKFIFSRVFKAFYRIYMCIYTFKIVIVNGTKKLTLS